MSTNRAVLAARLRSEIGLSHREAHELVEQFFQAIADALVQGRVTLYGFGTFIVRESPARVGRSPMDRSEIPIPSRRRILFRAGPMLRSRVAAGGHMRVCDMQNVLFGPPAGADRPQLRAGPSEPPQRQRTSPAEPDPSKADCRPDPDGAPPCVAAESTPRRDPVASEIS